MEAPADRRHVGRSYADFLRGRKPAWRNRLYFEYAYVRGIRTETLKYVERIKRYPSEMFDIEADPGETRDVIDEPAYRKQREALRADLAAYFQKNDAPPIEDWHSTTNQHLGWDK